MRHAVRVLSVIFALLLGPFAGQAEPLKVFAAASLKEALDEVTAGLDDVVLSYGGSGQIARQVALGAPADVVVLANVKWMDWLSGKGLTIDGSHLNLLGNRIVLIGPKLAEPLSKISEGALLARLNGGRLAMGQRDAVPAGIYGRQWLEAAGLWAALAPRLAETDNVRAALALVARGEAPLGIVYATDALAEPGVRVLYDVPDAMHERIIYPAAQIRDSAQAAEFMEYLVSDAAAIIFQRHGFITLAERP